MIRKNWLLIPLIVIGFYHNLWSIQTADKDMIFQDQFLAFILFLFLIFLGLSVNKDLKKYKISRSFKSFIPSIIGFLILISFAVVSLILNIRDNSRVIIYAGYDGDFNGAWFEFREDGTYKYVDHAGIGADITRGNYQIKDSIITLDKNKIGNMIVSNTLIIREENYGNSKYKVLYQINKNNIIINRNFKFLIDNDLQD